jgi:hypothetical protein
MKANSMQSEFTNTLFEDTKKKERVLSKLEIIFDDRRNEGMGDLNDKLDDFLKYGKSYKFEIKVTEI